MTSPQQTWKKRLYAFATATPTKAISSIAATLAVTAAATYFYLAQVTPADLSKQPEHLRNIIFLVAGFAAFAISIWRARIADKQADSTLRQIKVTEQGQITERFTRAIEQFGKSGPQFLFLRIGAIQALERIGNDSPDDLPAVIRMLAGFVQETSVAARKESEEELETLPSDVVKAVEALSRLNEKHFDFLKEQEISINFSGAYLHKLKLASGINLAEFNFQYATLNNAEIFGANLSNAKLFRAKLIGADLLIANLSNADISRANLRNVNLFAANLSNANITNSDLISAWLFGANLSKANLLHANLSNAKLISANLSGADISGANFYNANLSGASIKDINRDPKTGEIREGTTELLAGIEYDEDNPPKNCPEGVELPPPRGD